MLNKLLTFLRRYDMVSPGDHVICAVSGGADSVALLFAMYLLRDKLEIRLSAAHFNHHLRGEESNRDEAFVRDLCDRYDIPLSVGEGQVSRGKKGLEAAARDARYAFLKSLPGKIATAHTADDNAETVLLHLVRGTGLKGLGGIAPVNGNVIRPMLTVTRQDVEVFLEEWCLSCILDSSNAADEFLRNRLRHHVLPLLKQENPRLAENVSAMALRLRLDEECLAANGQVPEQLSVEELKQMHPARRSRVLEAFLKAQGIREPEAVHISQLEALICSEKPSARVQFPGGMTIARNYDALALLDSREVLLPVALNSQETVQWGNYRITCGPAEYIENTTDTFTVNPEGPVILRPREQGDAIRLSGGTKTLKKLFIDRKISAALRDRIPVLSDDRGVLGVYGLGVHSDRAAAQLPAVMIKVEKITEKR